MAIPFQEEINDDDLEYREACHQAVSKWYHLWMQWVRGLSDRQILVEEFESVTGTEAHQKNEDVSSSATMLLENPFTWIDVAGNVWKGLSFLHEPLVALNEDDVGDSTTAAATALEKQTIADPSSSNFSSFGSGAAWNRMETSIQDWATYRLEGEERQKDETKNRMGTNGDEKKHYRTICVVIQTIEKENGTVTISKRRVSAILQCSRESNCLQLDHHSNDISPVVVRLVQLHEGFVLGHEDSNATDQQSSELLEQEHFKPSRPQGSAATPSRHRYIAPPEVLGRYGAKPLLAHTSTNGGSGGLSSSSTNENANDLVGLSIQGWDIATSQGPIGDQYWFEEALEELEPFAQYQNSHVLQKNSDNDYNKPKSKGRKLVLPEMVFPLAHVVLEYTPSPAASPQNRHANKRGKKDNGQETIEDDAFLCWDATGALKEWSSAHHAIPLPLIGKFSSVGSGSSSNKAHEPKHVSSFRGVEVLESSDAELWRKKHVHTKKEGNIDDKNRDKSLIGNTEFHYDWTYSTPFMGNIFVSNATTHQQQEASCFSYWQPLPKSGMPMNLLTDTSAPILYYDNILLYEDDLHDNGAVEYSVKLRVMPQCAYVLARLFVRVDHVLIRLREARWLVEFKSCRSSDLPDSTDRVTKIFRDVTWRQASWKDLGSKYQLPTQVQAWTTNTATSESQAFQALLSRLPIVSLPVEIVPHGWLPYSRTE